MKTLKLYGLRTFGKIILPKRYQLVKGHKDILSAIAFHHYFSSRLISRIKGPRCPEGSKKLRFPN